MKEKLEERLKSESLKRKTLPPLRATLLTAFAGLLACLTIAASCLPATAAKLCAAVFAASCAVALASALWTAFAKGGSRREAATELDEKNQAKNRLEAYVELSTTDNPLKPAQAEDAAACYAKAKRSKWPLAAAAAFALTLLLLSGEGYTVCMERRAAGIQEEKKAEQIVKAKKEELKKREEEKKKLEGFASLEIVAPEPESRAKPIDEILWQAAGDSSAGFDSLTLEANVNGERKASLPIEGAPTKTAGTLSLEGSLALEDLKVAPFDFVSYNLKGLADLGDRKGVEILSSPQFIEVRPFREDAKTLVMLGGEKAKQLADARDAIAAFLRSEMLLNRALYAARASGLKPDSEIVAQQIALLARDQDALHSEVDKFIKETDPELLTPNEFDCVSKSVGHMGRASEKLGFATPGGKPQGLDLQGANDAQQQATAQLVAAMKEIQKALIIVMGNGSAAPRQEDPFMDKQTYKKPAMPYDESLEGKLQDALRDENKVVAKLEKAAEADSHGGQPPPMKEIAKQQASVSETLSKAASQGGVKQAIANTIAQAEKTSGAAEDAITTSDPRDALAAASRTKASISEALQALRKDAAKSMDETLADAQKSLNDAERKLAKNPDEAAREIANASRKLQDEALRQHKGGSQSMAESLADLAERLAKQSPEKELKNGDAGKSSEEKLKAMQDEVAALRGKSLPPKERLADAIEKLQASVKELEYATRNPKAVSAEGKREMLADAELAMQDASRAIKQLPAQKDETGKAAEDKQGSQGENSAQANNAKSAASSQSATGGQRVERLLGDNGKFVNIAFDDLSSDNLRRVTSGMKAMLELTQSALEAAREKEPVKSFNPDEVPKDYRDAVSNYFKRLSEGPLPKR